MKKDEKKIKKLETALAADKKELEKEEAAVDGAKGANFGLRCKVFMLVAMLSV